MAGKLLVRMQGRMIANDTLYELYGVINRNRGECDLDDSILMTQTLDLASKNLRSAHVWDTTWPNGERVLFAGALPAGVDEESILAISERH